MKKILFFIAMVAMIAAMAPAQVAVDVSGSVTTNFGLDLDEMDTGFEGSGSATATVSMDVDPTSAASAVEDGDTVYGQFSVGDIALEADTSGTAALTLAIGDPSAKIVLGNLTINLNASDLSVDYNAGLDNAYEYSIYSLRYGGSSAAHGSLTVAGIGAADIDGNAGIELVMSIPDIVDLALDVESHDSWTVADYENEYAIRGQVALTAVEGLELEVACNTDINYWENPSVALGAKASYAIGIGDEDSITPAVNFMYDFGEEAMGFGGGINAAVAGIVVTANASFADTDLSATQSGESLNYTVAADVGGLVDGLTLQVAFGAYNTLGATVSTGIELHAKAAYALAAGDMTITPSFECSADDPNIDAAAEWDNSFFAKAAVEISGLIDNTTFKLHWDSNDLTQTEQALGLTGAGPGPMGQIVLDTTVSL